MPFSERTNWNLDPNPFSRLLAEKQATETPLLDLTLSNPTHAGIPFDEEAVRSALFIASGESYQPDPKGLHSARLAVAAYYQARGFGVNPESIVLTTGTSEAYAFLFKLLCDPGGEILIPAPSYPLFGILSDLEAVGTIPYPLVLRDNEGWRWDADRIVERITTRTRAVIAISPNNPTGSTLRPAERSVVSHICRERDLALIVDEVFLDYSLPRGGNRLPSAAGNAECLTFVLSGLSKVACLPQMKLSWIAASGPGAEEAISRLEFLADAYLSVSMPIQTAAPAFLAGASRMQERICARLDENTVILKELTDADGRFRILPSDGGWYAVVELPNRWQDERAAMQLLESNNVVVHPGYFYDFTDEQVIVISLLTRSAEFAEGIRRILAALG